MTDAPSLSRASVAHVETMHVETMVERVSYAIVSALEIEDAQGKICG